MNMHTRTGLSTESANQPVQAERILFLGTAHDNGGSSILASQLAAAMREKGHHVEEWYLFGSAASAPGRWTRVFRQGPRSASPLVLLRLAMQLLAALREARPTAIFGLQPLSNLLVGICGRLAGVPRRIATLHLPRGEAHPVLMAIDRGVGGIGLYTDIIACGETVGESYRGNGKAYVSRLVVIPNGQPKPVLPSRAEARRDLNLPDGPLIGQIGRMSPQKNQAHTLDVLAGLPGVSALFVGSGPDENDVHAHAKALGLADRIRFQPSIPNAEIGKFYAAVDAVLFPSRYEGLSLAAIEAIHAGKPLVCSDIPSFRELFADSPFLAETLLVPLDNRARWIERIKQLLDDRALQAKVGDELATLSAKYSFEAMAEKYLALLSVR